jgi:phosphatidylglycerol---prolipoprotein diacylglyceryl transferase
LKELFSIGNFSIYLFGVAMAVGAIAGIFILQKEIKRKELNADIIMNLAIYTLIVSIIGARLYYIAAFDLKYYLARPIEMLDIRSGGLSIQGALIAGILFAIWYTKRNNISFLKAADAFAPAIAIGQAIGRIGCDVYGIPMKTIYPWGVKVNGQILHPAQMYEMVFDLILFVYLWTRKGKVKYNGQIFIHYIIGFSINRFIVEFIRVNPIVVGPFTIAHVTSFVMILIAILALKLIKSNQKLEDDNSANEITTTPLYEYIFVLLIGIIGSLIYYVYIN